MAAIASQTGKVGFVGGMDIPLIRNIQCEMLQKMEAAKADIISGKIKVADYTADNACKY